MGRLPSYPDSLVAPPPPGSVSFLRVWLCFLLFSVADPPRPSRYPLVSPFSFVYHVRPDHNVRPTAFLFFSHSFPFASKKRVSPCPMSPFFPPPSPPIEHPPSKASSFPLINKAAAPFSPEPSSFLSNEGASCVPPFPRPDSPGVPKIANGRGPLHKRACRSTTRVSLFSPLEKCHRLFH